MKSILNPLPPSFTKNGYRVYSLYYCLSSSYISRQKQVQNSIVQFVDLIVSFLSSIHWLIINERIKCKLLS